MAVKQPRNVAYGSNQPLINIFPFPIAANRNPGVSDRAELGTVWVNYTNNEVYILTSIVANVSNWANITGGAGDFNSLIVNPGPVDITSTLTTITGTADVAQLIYLHANGGVNESIDIHSDQGTGAASIDIHSDVGGLTIDGGLGTGDAVNIVASNVAGGIDIDAGTGGIIADTTGDISLDAAMASNFTVTGAGQDLLLNSVGGSVSITSTENVATAVSISATNAVAGGINIDGSTRVEILTTNDAGNIFIHGNPQTNAGAAAVIDSFVGVSTHTGLTTAAGAFETITITDNKVVVTSGILVSAANFGANDAKMTVVRVIPGAGTFDVILENRGGAALNGNLVISFMVLS